MNRGHCGTHRWSLRHQASVVYNQVPKEQSAHMGTRNEGYYWVRHLIYCHLESKNPKWKCRHHEQIQHSWQHKCVHNWQSKWNTVTSFFLILDVYRSASLWTHNDFSCIVKFDLLLPSMRASKLISPYKNIYISLSLQSCYFSLQRWSFLITHMHPTLHPMLRLQIKMAQLLLLTKVDDLSIQIVTASQPANNWQSIKTPGLWITSSLDFVEK